MLAGLTLYSVVAGGAFVEPAMKLGEPLVNKIFEKGVDKFWEKWLEKKSS